MSLQITKKVKLLAITAAAKHRTGSQLQLLFRHAGAHACPGTRGVLGTRTPTESMQGQPLHPANSRHAHREILLCKKAHKTSYPFRGIMLTKTYSQLKTSSTGEHQHALPKKGNYVLANSHFLMISPFIATSIYSCIPQCFIQLPLVLSGLSFLLFWVVCYPALLSYFCILHADIPWPLKCRYKWVEPISLYCQYMMRREKATHLKKVKTRKEWENESKTQPFYSTSQNTSLDFHPLLQVEVHWELFAWLRRQLNWKLAVCIFIESRLASAASRKYAELGLFIL